MFQNGHGTLFTTSTWLVYGNMRTPLHSVYRLPHRMGQLRSSHSVRSARRHLSYSTPRIRVGVASTVHRTLEHAPFVLSFVREQTRRKISLRSTPSTVVVQLALVAHGLWLPMSFSRTLLISAALFGSASIIAVPEVRFLFNWQPRLTTMNELGAWQRQRLGLHQLDQMRHCGHPRSRQLLASVLATLKTWSQI